MSSVLSIRCGVSVGVMVVCLYAIGLSLSVECAALASAVQP